VFVEGDPEVTGLPFALQAEGIDPNMLSMVFVTSTDARPDSIIALMILCSASRLQGRAVHL
jgi:hypothetical protein